MEFLKKSPIYYMGNKYTLLPEIIKYFPQNCDTFIDCFGGSGVVCMNYKGNSNTIYNEINDYVISLIKWIKESNIQDVNTQLILLAKKYGLNTHNIDNKRNGFNKLRQHYNDSLNKDPLLLYLLICNANNHLIRFNKDGQYNTPVGDGKYDDKDYQRMLHLKKEFKNINIQKSNFFDIHFDEIKENDFLYLDPPYSNTIANYNLNWTLDDDFRMFEILKELDKRNIKWGMSNIFFSRGKYNTHLIDWCQDNHWEVFHIDKQYHPFGKEVGESDEVFICNYQPKQETIQTLFDL